MRLGGGRFQRQMLELELSLVDSGIGLRAGVVLRRLGFRVMVFSRNHSPEHWRSTTCENEGVWLPNP